MHSFLFVASIFQDDPILVDVSETTPVKRRLSSVPRRRHGDEEKINERQAAQDAKLSTCVTIFTSIGNHIIAGTSKGWINIIETETCRTIHSKNICNNLISYLRLSASGRDIVSNSGDRIVRTMPIPDFSRADLDIENLHIDIEHKFQDVVNRLSWNHITFSSTGEYVAASTYMNHDVYVWERGHGSLVKILEGPKEELGHLDVSVCIN